MPKDVLVVRAHDRTFHFDVWEDFDIEQYDAGEWFHTPQGSFRIAEIQERFLRERLA